MKDKKTVFLIVSLLLTVGSFLSCQRETASRIPSKSTEKKEEKIDFGDRSLKTEKAVFIDPRGTCLAERILTPDGFTRISSEAGDFSDFLRSFKLKKDNSPVLLYDGREKNNQKAHVAVFDMPVENKDLQQCADSIMRLYAEYYWKNKEYDRITFHFVSGFEADYSKWMQGYRIKVEDNQVSWIRAEEYDDSYESFCKYLRMVFAYAGTMSMTRECEPAEISKMKIGDVFLEAGSPGHVVMVVDLCQNKEGETAFLLAQGYMPAQEFHILRNPNNERDPWYYESDFHYPFETPEYVFNEGSLKHLNY